MQNIIETFKDAKALVTDVLVAPFEDPIVKYQAFRRAGLSPIQAGALTVGSESLVHGMGVLGASLVMSVDPKAAAGFLAFSVLLAGNVSASVNDAPNDPPRWPRIAARNTLRSKGKSLDV